MVTTLGAVTSGVAPVVKLELKLIGLPTWSVTPFSVIVRIVLAGSGALGMNSIRVSLLLNQ